MADQATVDPARCITCEALESYSVLSGQYVGSMSEALSGPIAILFMALLGLWVAYTGLQFVMVRLSPSGVLQDFLCIIIASSLIYSQDTDFIANIYNSSLEIMTSAATIAFSLGPGSPDISDAGLSGLMRAAEAG